jgi:hypothetical protein
MTDSKQQHPRSDRREILIGGLAAVLLPAGAAMAQSQSVPSPDPDAPNAPAVSITNGLVTAVLYLPDPEKGYYRATRFDWSGQIAELKTGGHSYFGRWNPAKYDPKLHDAIMGPVQEFVDGQGFGAAPIGGTFIKVGVGVLRKPAEPIRGFPTLEIVDGGKWTTRVRRDAVDFTHEVSDPSSGYGYRYTKTVSLPRGKRQLVLTQKIESTGQKTINTQMYDHNFFVFDGEKVGPDVEVRFPFKIEPFNVRGSDIVFGEKQLNYKNAITTANRMQIKGFSNSAKDYDIHIENKKTGAGVHITGNRPLSDFVFWTNPNTPCAEAYIHVFAPPGEPMSWQITYDFYSLKTA